MTDEKRQYCAELALAAGEPLLGTAPQVDAWLLLEYQPVWEKKALENNQLPDFVNEWISNVVATLDAAGYKPRAQFIRRRRDRNHALNLFTARDGRFKRYTFDSYEAMVNASLDDDDGETVTEPHYFVCSNGRRDLCCSRFGLPVYAELRGHVGDRVWETSHVGGHRYAANVLTLPQGALYGYLNPHAVADFVANVEAGKLAMEHLRGRSAYPPAAQAAETLVNETDATLEAVDADIVTFKTSSGVVRVRATRADTALQVVPSCGKTLEAHYPWQVERMSPT